MIMIVYVMYVCYVFSIIINMVQCAIKYFPFTHTQPQVLINLTNKQINKYL